MRILSFPRMASLLCLGLALLPVRSGAQVAFWQKEFGGAQFDKVLKTLRAPDGGLVMAIETQSSDGLGSGNRGGSDILLMKYSTQGKIFWKILLGGSGQEELHDLIPAAGGGYFLAGASGSADGDLPGNKGDSDCWVACVSESGRLLWSKTYGGSGYDRALCLFQSPEGELYAGGESASRNGDCSDLPRGGLDSWLLRLSSQGRLLWEKRFGGSGNEKINRIFLRPDGQLLLVHSSDSRDKDIRQPLGRKDVWITRHDGRGELVWQGSYGGEDHDEMHDATLDSLGMLTLAGTSFSRGGHISIQRGEGDGWLMKLAPDGSLLWSATYGGPRGEGFSSLAPTYDGGYIACGMTKSRTGEGDIEFNGGYFDGWVVKVNEYGERVWSRTLGYEGMDALSHVSELPEGGYLLSGQTVQGAAPLPAPGTGGISDGWLINLSDPKRDGVRPYVTPALLFGTVRAAGSGKALDARIILSDNRSLDSLASTRSAPEDGSFSLLLPAYGLTSINVLSPGYLFYGQDLNMDTLVRKNLIEIEVELQPIRIGSSLILKNIYFEAGKWDLLPASFAELQRLAVFLKLNPRVQIQVSGHTDNTGNKAEKQALSLNRATAVRDYLVQQGISSKRMLVKGYGMFRPIAPNTSAEGRQKNRRVEFEVISM